MPNEELKEYFTSKNIRNWKQLNEIYESQFRTESQWIFRGQRNKDWGLQSSLERAIADFGIDLREASNVERGLLRKFKRQYHHDKFNTPQKNDSLEWLALMQHYGTPTRLLDWTYSFYVALYFAIESADENGCVVWCLNTDFMADPFKSTLEPYPDVLECWENDRAILQQDTFKKLFAHNPAISLVGAVTPRKLNERMVIQQGLFLCPGDVCKPFEENLIALLSASKPQVKTNFVKITIQSTLEIKKDILLSLQRMNMNNATLFPGLVGFAHSLRTQMASHKVLLNPGNEEL